MDQAGERWRTVDEYLVATIIDEDDALRSARLGGPDAGLPAIEVSPNLGALLGLLARLSGARTILEIGTLGGYSTIWLARAAGAGGRVTTLELDPAHAAHASRNLQRAGVADRVDIVEGRALDSLEKLIAVGAGPFDLVFIDADKENIPGYVTASLKLTRPGSVIVVDNVVRGGGVADPDSPDPANQGVRRFLEMVAEDPRLDGTALQTVGAKGWDGFAVALVR